MKILLSLVGFMLVVAYPLNATIADDVQVHQGDDGGISWPQCIVDVDALESRPVDEANQINAFLRGAYYNYRNLVERVGTFGVVPKLMYTAHDGEFYRITIEGNGRTWMGNNGGFGYLVSWDKQAGGFTALRNNELIRYGVGRDIRKQQLWDFAERAAKHHVSMSEDGATIGFRDAKGRVQLVRNGKMQSFDDSFDPTVSYDGSTFAFSATASPYVFRVVKDDRSQDFEIPYHPSFWMAPMLNRDGSKLAFRMRGEKDTSQIGVMDLQTGAVKRITSESTHHYFPVYSPDSKRLAFLQTDEAKTDPDEPLQVVVYDFESGKETVIAKDAGFYRPVWWNQPVE